MNHVALVNKCFLWGNACAIYSIWTVKKDTVYMRVDRTNYCNDKRAVVVVDSSKLLSCWRAYPHSREPVAFMDEVGWRKDYKFGHAEGGFARGIENPVPLARIGVYPPVDTNGTASVAFSNGITRTIWLLANGAPAFPIECSTDEASALHTAAGLKGVSVLSVDKLLGGLI